MLADARAADFVIFGYCTHRFLVHYTAYTVCVREGEKDMDEVPELHVTEGRRGEQ